MLSSIGINGPRKPEMITPQQWLPRREDEDGVGGRHGMEPRLPKTFGEGYGLYQSGLRFSPTITGHHTLTWLFRHPHACRQRPLLLPKTAQTAQPLRITLHDHHREVRNYQSAEMVDRRWIRMAFAAVPRRSPSSNIASNNIDKSGRPEYRIAPLALVSSASALSKKATIQEKDIDSTVRHHRSLFANCNCTTAEQDGDIVHRGAVPRYWTTGAAAEKTHVKPCTRAAAREWGLFQQPATLNDTKGLFPEMDKRIPSRSACRPRLLRCHSPSSASTNPLAPSQFRIFSLDFWGLR
ncbi:hypothetical protein FDECE_11256 [Fusarium decemcellulare]|nr:hypothetical protein FDECE_11256 [Fusarium decemcellulare]